VFQSLRAKEDILVKIAPLAIEEREILAF